MNALYTILSIVPSILSGIGTSIGQGIINKNAMEGQNRQPSASGSISKIAIIGMAIVETAAIMGMVISILLLNNSKSCGNPFFDNLAVAGIALALGISGLVQVLLQLFLQLKHVKVLLINRLCKINF